MKCPKCNELNHEPGAMFCHACGERIANTEQYIKYLHGLKNRDELASHLENLKGDELTAYWEDLKKRISRYEQLMTSQYYTTPNLKQQKKRNSKQLSGGTSPSEYSTTRKELNKWIIISSILAASIVGIPIALFFYFRNVIPMYKQLKTLRP